MTVDALTEYLTLPGSTTRFLQQQSGEAVLARVHQQKELSRGKMLERVSTLHVGGSAPVLAAKCLLSLTDLSTDEIARLKDTAEPIGSVLLSSRSDELRRENVSLQRLARHPLSQFLSVDSSAFHVKTFELWQGDRFIGDLEELVCRESFDRLHAPKAAPGSNVSKR